MAVMSNPYLKCREGFLNEQFRDKWKRERKEEEMRRVELIEKEFLPVKSYIHFLSSQMFIIEYIYQQPMLDSSTWQLFDPKKDVKSFKALCNHAGKLEEVELPMLVIEEYKKEAGL